jgi:hypothetical protein
MDPNNIDQVKQLYSEIPGLVKRVAGRSIPIEKFALKRAELVLRENRTPFHPALELALVWDGITMISRDNQMHTRETMSSALSVVHDAEQKCQILLTLAVIARLDKSHDASIRYANNALKLKVPNDSYCEPLAHLELSQNYLAEGMLSKAEHHYKESIGYRHEYLVRKFFEIRQSRLRMEIDLAKERAKPKR